MDAESQLILDLEEEIRILTKAHGDSLHVMRLATAFFTIKPRNVESKQNDSVIEDQKDNVTNSFIHQPKLICNKLSFFSRSDIYKHFTHETRSNEFNYEKLYERIEWTEHFGKFFHEFNPKTYYRIYNFIYLDKEPLGFWTDQYKITMTWRSPEIALWCSNHLGEYPLDVEVPFEKKRPSKKNPKIRYEYFGEIINQFKHDIEQRTTDRTRTLDETIKKIFVQSGLDTDFKLVLDSVSFKSVSFFADVVQIKEAFRTIFKWILPHKYKLNEEVEIKIIESSDFYDIEILHKGAYIMKQPTGMKINGTGGDTMTLKEELRSVCDWHVIYSNHLKKSYLFKYLTDGCDIREPVSFEEVDFIDGISHKLFIYK